MSLLLLFRKAGVFHGFGCWTVVSTSSNSWSAVSVGAVSWSTTSASVLTWSTTTVTPVCAAV